MAFYGLLRKFRSLVGRGGTEADLADELALHVDLQVQKHIALGMSEKEARRLARMEFGAMEAAREECREADRWRALDTSARNFRQAFRSLRKTPGFAAIAVSILAMAIGSNLAVFHLVNALLLRPLPLKNASELVRISLVHRDGELGELPSTFLASLKQVPDYQGLCGFDTGYPGVEVGGTIVSVGTLGFSGDCFRTLGIGMQIGRSLTTEDDRTGAAPVAVITDAFWRRQFDGRADVLGKRIRMEGQIYTVVGVTEPRFQGLLLGFPAGMITTLSQEFNAPLPNGKRHTYWPVNILARRAAGISEAEALARLGVRSRQLLEDSVPPNYNAARRREYVESKVALTPGKAGIDYFLRNRFGGSLYAAAGVCAALLLIGCVNLVNLLLARSMKRRREVAVRVVLGAKRGDVAWLFATESFLLTGAGALLGFLLALGLDAWFMATGDRMFGNFDLSLAFDWRMATFFVGAVAAISAAFTAASAWQAQRLGGSETLKEGGRGLIGSENRPQKILIAVQIALTLALVAVSGLFSASLKKFYALNLGVSSKDVWDVMLAARPGVEGHFEKGPYYQDLLQQVKSLSDVKSAALADWIPFFIFSGDETVTAIDIGDTQREAQAEVKSNSADFTRTLGLKMVAGEGFSADERKNGEPAVIISQSLAERLGGNPRKMIGHHLRVGLSNSYQRLRISGIVSNAQMNLAQPENLTPYVAYVNIWQHPDTQGYPVLFIKTRSNSFDVASLRKIVNARGREYVYRVRTLTNEKDGALMENRLLAYLSGAFSALALLMAATGLFGLLSYQVSNRTGEIGIRMALGAERGQIGWLIMQQILTVVAIGTGAGFLLSLAIGRALAGLLFEVSPYSPGLLTICCLVLLATALIAAWLPVRRATSVDPAIALRHE